MTRRATCSRASAPAEKGGQRFQPDRSVLVRGRLVARRQGGSAVPSSGQPQQRGGYVLLEIIIALTVFAVVVAGLASVLHSSLDAANLLRRQGAIQRGIEALLIEAQNKPKREEMATTYKDEALGVEFRSELEELKWINRKGKPVRGLYILRVVASDLRAAKPLHDDAEVYVYRP